jgi:hypothetical protein
MAHGLVCEKTPDSSDKRPTARLKRHVLVAVFPCVVSLRCAEFGPPGTRVAALPFEGKNKVVFWLPEGTGSNLSAPL